MKTHRETANKAHIKRQAKGSPQQWVWILGTTEGPWHAD